MTTPLVECIPNFSEGRRLDVIAAIVAAITSVAEILLLNQSSDEDHNRTVVTFAGPPRAVEEAAFRAVQKATELINLDEHTGSHPRLGAADVIPFVPLAGVEMAECVAIAHHLGDRIGDELDIPVYFYEAAAIRPERVNLEDVRRGQYEGLKLEIGSNLKYKPDCGPSRLGPAGACIIGARNPLIAYNIYLTTADVTIASAIAKAVRQSSGGFRFVKALGMLVEGRAQVTMNLTNFRQTPIYRVVEVIRREAARYGVTIHHSELVGLIPQNALLDTAVWYLQLDGFDPLQVLEKRLYEINTTTGPASANTFLDELAAAKATPGGGSAAAYAGAMAAALVAMVARLTIGKKKYADVEAQMNEILNHALSLRSELIAAVEEDAASFEAIMTAFHLPKDTPEQQAERSAAIEVATLNAAQVPLETAAKAVKIIALAERCIALGNLNAISDAGSAFHMASAALASAGYNVRINVNSLTEKTAGEPLLVRMTALEVTAGNLEKKVRKAIQDRGGQLLT